MEVGSLVETIGDFTELRMTWNLPYPKKGKILTVASIILHHNNHSRKKGIVLLKFEELPNLVEVCDKTINGKINFVEVLPPVDLAWVEALLKKKENVIYI